MLGFLGNILPANEKCPVLEHESFVTLVQIELSRKRKRFSDFLVPFLGKTVNLEHL